MAGEIKFTINGKTLSLQEGEKLKNNDLKELKWLGSLWNGISDGDNVLDKEEANVLRLLSSLLGSGVEWTKENVAKLIQEFDKQDFKVGKFLEDKITAKQQEAQRLALEAVQANAKKLTAESYDGFKEAYETASKAEGFDEKAFVEKFLSDKLEYAKNFSDFKIKYDEAKKAQGDKFVEKDFVFEFIKSKFNEAKSSDDYDAALAEAKKQEGFDIYKFTQEFIAQKEAASKAAAEQETLPVAPASVDPLAELKAKYTNDYTIKQDETLGFIAKKILQDKGKTKPTRAEIMELVNEIAEMNGIDKNTYMIRVDQKIKLPVANLIGVQTITSGRKSGGSGGTGGTGGAGGSSSATVNYDSARVAEENASKIGEIIVNRKLTEVEAGYRGVSTDIITAVFTNKNISGAKEKLKSITPENAAYVTSQFYLSSNISDRSKPQVDVVSALHNLELGKDEIVLYVLNPLMQRAEALGISFKKLEKDYSLDDVKKLVSELESAILKKDKEQFIPQEQLYYNEALGSLSIDNVKSIVKQANGDIVLQLNDGNTIYVKYTDGKITGVSVDTDPYNSNMNEVSFTSNNVYIRINNSNENQPAVSMKYKEYKFTEVTTIISEMINAGKKMDAPSNDYGFSYDDYVDFGKGLMQQIVDKADSEAGVQDYIKQHFGALNKDNVFAYLEGMYSGITQQYANIGKYNISGVTNEDSLIWILNNNTDYVTRENIFSLINLTLEKAKENGFEKTKEYCELQYLMGEYLMGYAESNNKFTEQARHGSTKAEKKGPLYNMLLGKALRALYDKVVSNDTNSNGYNGIKTLGQEVVTEHNNETMRPAKEYSYRTRYSLSILNKDNVYDFLNGAYSNNANLIEILSTKVTSIANDEINIVINSTLSKAEDLGLNESEEYKKLSNLMKYIKDNNVSSYNNMFSSKTYSQELDALLKALYDKINTTMNNS